MLETFALFGVGWSVVNVVEDDKIFISSKLSIVLDRCESYRTNKLVSLA